MPHQSLNSFTKRVSLETTHTGIIYCQVSMWKTELFLRQAILFFIHVLAGQRCQVSVPLCAAQTQKWQPFLQKFIKVKSHLLEYSVRIHLQLSSPFLVQVTSETFGLDLLSLTYSTVMAILRNTQSHELQNLHISTKNLKSSWRKLDKHLGSFIPLVTRARLQLDVLPLRQNRTASQQRCSGNEGPPEKIWILCN